LYIRCLKGCQNAPEKQKKKSCEEIKEYIQKREGAVLFTGVFYACHHASLLLPSTKRHHCIYVVSAYNSGYLTMFDLFLDMNFWKKLGERVCLLRSGMGQQWLPGWR